MECGCKLLTGEPIIDLQLPLIARDDGDARSDNDVTSTTIALNHNISNSNASVKRSIGSKKNAGTCDSSHNNGSCHCVVGVTSLDEEKRWQEGRIVNVRH